MVYQASVTSRYEDRGLNYVTAHELGFNDLSVFAFVIGITPRCNGLTLITSSVCCGLE